MGDVQRDTLVEDVLQYVRAELGDVALHKALETITRLFKQTSTIYETVEGQLVNRLFHRMKCVLLLHKVLDSPSVVVGISTSRAQDIAISLVSCCRSQAIERNSETVNYFMISRIIIVFY